jgi:RimJ/RimL family protein N-acetyltransferase
MANFYMTLPAEEISRQVAELLNHNNQLRTEHNAYTIMNARGAYFVDVVAGIVAGCQAILRINDELTKLFHLCVHPDFRRRGIARKLKLAALNHVSTPYVYATVREDNIASINLSLSLGFNVAKKERVGDHNVLTLGRMMYNAATFTTTTIEMVGGEYAGTASETKRGVSTDGLFFVGR